MTIKDLLHVSLHEITLVMAEIQFINPSANRESWDLANAMVAAEVWQKAQYTKHHIQLVEFPEPTNGVWVVCLQYYKLDTEEMFECANEGNPQTAVWQATVWDQGELRQGKPYGPSHGGSVGARLTLREFKKYYYRLVHSRDDEGPQYAIYPLPEQIWVSKEEGAYPKEWQKFGLDFGDVYRYMQEVHKKGG